MIITLDDLKRALQLPQFDALTAQMRMSPTPRGLRPQPTADDPPREAGVLVLVYPEQENLNIVLTRRTDTLRGHTGQISFPGGRRDPDDATITDTALRETCEELGICDSSIEVLGMLSQIYIPPTNFDVTPTVAYLPYIPLFAPNPHEVAEVFPLPLRLLLAPETKHEEQREIRGYNVHVPYYLVNGHKVWGATAIMLSELENRLRAVLPISSH